MVTAGHNKLCKQIRGQQTAEKKKASLAPKCCRRCLWLLQLVLDMQSYAVLQLLHFEFENNEAKQNFQLGCRGDLGNAQVYCSFPARNHIEKNCLKSEYLFWNDCFSLLITWTWSKGTSARKARSPWVRERSWSYSRWARLLPSAMSYLQLYSCFNWAVWTRSVTLTLKLRRCCLRMSVQFVRILRCRSHMEPSLRIRCFDAKTRGATGRKVRRSCRVAPWDAAIAMQWFLPFRGMCDWLSWHWNGGRTLQGYGIALMAQLC